MFSRERRVEYKILILLIIFYELISLYLLPFNFLSYPITSLIFLIFISYLLYITNPYPTWGFIIAEVALLVSIKCIEFTFLFNPVQGSLYSLNLNIFKLDRYFIDTLVLIMFTREVGLNPFNFNYENLQKYLLAGLVSYLFLYSYI